MFVMAYDRELAQRIREVLASVPGVTERKMFGGLAFLIQGHMTVVATSNRALMIRTDPSTSADLVGTTRATFAEMRGQQMHSWLCLAALHVQSEPELITWIDLAINYSSNLRQKP